MSRRFYKRYTTWHVAIVAQAHPANLRAAKATEVAAVADAIE